jgi:hypothetical protein
VFRVVLLPRALVALMCWVALLPGFLASAQELQAQEQGADAASADPRPAQVQVIAHGVVPMPATEIAWRLSRREAVAPERAVLENRAARFVLADDGVIAIVDDTGAILTRLSPGEAIWTEPGSRAVVSLDGNRAGYYEIALVPAAAQTAASDVAATTAAFPAPDAEAVDVDLIRDALERDEEREIPAGLTPLLLAVTSGKVFTETENGEISELAAGEFVQIAGGVVVVGASRAPATFVVARVDSSIAEQVTLKDLSPVSAATLPPAASPAAAATPVGAPDGPASVAVSAFVCPAAYRGDDFAADCTLPAEGTAFSIEAEGEALLSELTGDDGALTFIGVPPGDYALVAGVPEDVASSWVSCRNIRGDQFRRASERPRTTLSLGRKDHVSCDWYILPDGGRDVMRSSLTVSILACPEGMTAERFDPEACEPPSAGTRLILGDADGKHIEAAVKGPNTWVWKDLGARSYSLDFEAQPAGISDSALGKQPCCGEENDFTVGVPSGFARIERTLFLFPPDVPRDLALTVFIRACPPGMTAESLVAELCQPAPSGVTLTLLEHGAPVGVAAAAADAWVWNGLGPLDYALKVNATPPSFTAFQLDDEACCAAEADFAFTLEEGDIDVQRTLYLFQSLDGANGEGDADADGLSDARELEIGTNPFLPDADDDGLADGDEVNFYGTDPRQPDTDEDGFDDTEEMLTYSTNPLIADTDGDGVSDRGEVTAGSDPLDTTSVPATPAPIATVAATPAPSATPVAETPEPATAATPADEPASLPTVAPAAVSFLSPDRPVSAVGSPESPEEALDGDGLPTLDEIAIHSTDPMEADTDGDGVGDGDEVAAGMDPRDPQER